MAFQRKCSKCGKQNRVPGKHLASAGKCGECKSPLAPLDEPVAVTQSEFDEITGASELPVVVDFWAEWCPPCRAAAPHFAAVAKEKAGTMLFLKVNSDNEQGLARRFNVSGIPNFVVIKGGEVLGQQAGAMNAAQMRQWLSAW